MSVSGIIGTFLGVRSPGTAYVLLHHYMGEIDGAMRAWGFAKGRHRRHQQRNCKVRAVSWNGDRHRGACQQRHHQERQSCLVSHSKTVDEFRADTVIFRTRPAAKLTWGWSGKRNLDSELITQLGHYKFRGSSGKVNLAVDRLPQFSSRPGDGPAPLWRCPRLRRAFNTSRRLTTRRSTATFRSGPT